MARTTEIAIFLLLACVCTAHTLSYDKQPYAFDSANISATIMPDGTLSLHEEYDIYSMGVFDHADVSLPEGFSVSNASGGCSADYPCKFLVSQEGGTTHLRLTPVYAIVDIGGEETKYIPTDEERKFEPGKIHLWFDYAVDGAVKDYNNGSVLVLYPMFRAPPFQPTPIIFMNISEYEVTPIGRLDHYPWQNVSFSVKLEGGAANDSVYVALPGSRSYSLPAATHYDEMHFGPYDMVAIIPLKYFSSVQKAGETASADELWYRYTGIKSDAMKKAERIANFVDMLRAMLFFISIVSFIGLAYSLYSARLNLSGFKAMEILAILINVIFFIYMLTATLSDISRFGFSIIVSNVDNLARHFMNSVGTFIVLAAHVYAFVISLKKEHAIENMPSKIFSLIVAMLSLNVLIFSLTENAAVMLNWNAIFSNPVGDIVPKALDQNLWNTQVASLVVVLLASLYHAFDVGAMMKRKLALDTL